MNDPWIDHESFLLTGIRVTSTKQIVQDEFSLDAFRVLIPVNALGRYHSDNYILIGFCCLDECPYLALNVIFVLGCHCVWSVPDCCCSFSRPTKSLFIPS